MPRAPKQPILFQEKLKIPEGYLRFSTPKEVADYRAEKLKCNVLLEIGAGIGGQTIAFSKKCKKVIAIEIDGKQAEILKNNLKKLNIKNVEIISGDALSEKIIEIVENKSPEIIFCDTERKESGERTLKELSPDISQIIKKYSPITKKIAIEIPPFTKDLDSLKENFEEEFISLNNKLNRLTLYFNELKKSDVSVVSLPSKIKIEKKEGVEICEEVKSFKNFEFLYLINPAIILAELINELTEKNDLKIIRSGKKIYFVSNSEVTNEFLEGYNILSICKNIEEEIIENLKKLDAGEVVLRYEIEPEKYWSERKKYEKNLDGKRKIHLFAKGDEIVLCEKIG